VSNLHANNAVYAGNNNNSNGIAMNGNNNNNFINQSPSQINQIN